MQVNLKNLVSMTDANQNFSKVAKLVDENGTVVILKNNVPRYVLIDFNEMQGESYADDDTIEQIARDFMQKHPRVFEELAK